MILNTGGFGITLKEVLDKYGTDFEIIMIRCLWDNNGKQNDDLIGYCKWVNGELIPLDGDYYSLNDLYIKYEYDLENDMLIVWEKGAVTNKYV